MLLESGKVENEKSSSSTYYSPSTSQTLNVKECVVPYGDILVVRSLFRVQKDFKDN